jgi:DNA-binding NtrC family response regulator
MATAIISSTPLATRIRPRTALVASADGSFRQRLTETLTGLRWQVRETDGGAEAWTEAEKNPPEAVIVDSWLPDLDLAEFLEDFRARFPDVDLVTVSGSTELESPRGPHRQELLYALRRTQDNDTAVWKAAPALDRAKPSEPTRVTPWPLPAAAAHSTTSSSEAYPAMKTQTAGGSEATSTERLPELIGNAPCMLGDQPPHPAGGAARDGSAD